MVYQLLAVVGTTDLATGITTFDNPPAVSPGLVTLDANSERVPVAEGALTTASAPEPGGGYTNAQIDALLTPKISKQEADTRYGRLAVANVWEDAQEFKRYAEFTSSYLPLRVQISSFGIVLDNKGPIAVNIGNNSLQFSNGTVAARFVLVGGKLVFSGAVIEVPDPTTAQGIASKAYVDRMVGSGQPGHTFDPFDVSLAIRQAVVDGFAAQTGDSPFLSDPQPAGSLVGMEFDDPDKRHSYRFGPVPFASGTANVWRSFLLSNALFRDPYAIGDNASVTAAVTDASNTWVNGDLTAYGLPALQDAGAPPAVAGQAASILVGSADVATSDQFDIKAAAGDWGWHYLYGRRNDGTSGWTRIIKGGDGFLNPYAVPVAKALQVIADYQAAGGPFLETDKRYFGCIIIDDRTADEFKYECSQGRPLAPPDPNDPNPPDPRQWKWRRYLEAGV